MSVILGGSFKKIAGSKLNGGTSNSGGGGDIPTDGLVFDFEVGSGLDLTGTSVNTWVDTTGNYTLTGVGSKPQYVSGNNSVQFNFNQYATFNTTSTMRTVAAVMRYDDSIKVGPGGRQMFMFGDETNYFFVSGTGSNLVYPSILSGSPTYIDGEYIDLAGNVLMSSLKPDFHVVVMIFQADQPGSIYSNIGRDRIYHEFAGNIKELIAWNIALDSTQISDVSSALASKYSL